MLRMFHYPRIPILTLFLFGLFPVQGISQEAVGEKTQQYEQSINNIGKKIKGISRTLNANKALVATQRDKLLEIEQKLHSSKLSLQQTEYDLSKNQHQYDALVLQIKKVKESQSGHRESLKNLLINRYRLGRPDFLKSLLNQENPYAVGRLSNYQQYFSGALKNKFEQLGQKAKQLEILSRDQSKVINALQKEREKQKILEQEYQESKNLRAITIAKLDQKIVSSGEILETLRKDRKRLESLLKQLKRQAAELKRLDELKAKQEAELRDRKNNQRNVENSAKPSPRKLVKGGFLKQLGRLDYPVTGQLLRKFGSRLPESGMRSEGSFFDTDGSVPVKSIFRGRVLFADFLKGFGLLIIVDHGDDHISLYGHNDRLLKKVGDKVNRNEPIARSGVTGGLKSHGLYFEIRDNATPVDASKWFR